jgi:hypothetical protein
MKKMISLLALPAAFALVTPGAMAAGRVHARKSVTKATAAPRHVKRAKMAAATKSRKKQQPSNAQTI